jgi:hypothetical protein
MPEPGRYLYAVIDDPAPCEFGPIGIDGSAVYTLPEGAVAAVVSDVPNKKIRPERRKVAAHHQVLKALMAGRTVLPMAFGVIADGPDAVRGILARNAEAFASQLARFRGHAEMGLKVTLNVPNVFEYVLNAHPELRQLRDRVFAPGANPGPEAKMELGRQFGHAVTADRAAAVARVLEVLRPVASEVKEEAPKGETEVMNLAFLVRADAAAAFDAAVTAAAAKFGEEFAFALSGPWPPHSFVEPGLDASPETP